MKNDIRNIINFENLTRVRNSINIVKNLPPKDSFVKLIPIEYLKHGVKVLIDGKLFIAIIDEKIPIKEEIIAYVTNNNPFLLTLNLSDQLRKNKNYVLDQVSKKFELGNNGNQRQIIEAVIQNGNILIKSKVQSLFETLKYINASGLELSLLADLIWHNNDKQKLFIKDLYDNLFDETFENVCKQLFSSIKDLLFMDLPQYLALEISNNLIYDNDEKNSKALAENPKTILSIIKLLNENINNFSVTDRHTISDFIYNGTKYILQKSVLKDYDYSPDFLIIKKDGELSLIHYNVKKLISKDNNVSYKLLFKHEKLPFQLSGFFRDNFLLGNMELNEEVIDNLDLAEFQNKLNKNWGINSDIKLNEHNDNQDKYVTKISKEINKLVS